MRRTLLSLVIPAALGQLAAEAALVSYNSASPDQSATARASFHGAMGISAPQFAVDFETGFTDEQNVSGVVGLFPDRLVIRDLASSNPRAIIQHGPGSIEYDATNPFLSPSNPVGEFALAHTPSGFSNLQLDFSASPIDYLSFQDIDTDSNNSRIRFTFADGSTFLWALPDSTLASGDSAEFLGFYRNDLPRITHVELDFTGVTYAIDNLEYGRVPESTAIPEPSAAALIFAGACIAGLRRSRHRSFGCSVRHGQPARVRR